MLHVRCLAILFAGLLLSSCVVTQQDLQMQRDLLELKRRLGEAERAVKEMQDDTSGGVRAHVETLAGNQADFQAELDGVRVYLSGNKLLVTRRDLLPDDIAVEPLASRSSMAPMISSSFATDVAGRTTRVLPA